MITSCLRTISVTVADAQDLEHVAEYGYEIVPLPKATVGERRRFILAETRR